MDKFIPTKKPNIHILSIEDDENGNPKFSYEVNDAFIEMVKKDTHSKELKEEQITLYISELLNNCASKENGHDYKKIDLTNNKIDK